MHAAKTIATNNRKVEIDRGLGRASQQIPKGKLVDEMAFSDSENSRSWPILAREIELFCGWGIAAICVLTFSTSVAAQDRRAAKDAAERMTAASEVLLTVKSVSDSELRSLLASGNEDQLSSEKASLLRAIRKLRIPGDAAAPGIENEVRKRITTAALDEAFASALILDTRMSSQLEALGVVVKSVGLTDLYNRKTNLWEDEAFYNGWDLARDIGTGVSGALLIAGAATAIGGLFFEEGQTKTILVQFGTVATGLGGSGVAGSQLIGALLGGASGTMVKEKIEFIDFTRRAYDSIAERLAMAALMEERIEKYAKSLKKNIDHPNHKTAVSWTASEKIAWMTTLSAQISDYRVALGLMPQYYDTFISLDKTLMSEGLNDNVVIKEKMTAVVAEAKAAKKKYDLMMSTDSRHIKTFQIALQRVLAADAP